MRVRVMEQKAPACFKQVATHFDVVMGEIEQEHFEAHQGFRPRVHSEFRQLTDEPDNLHFGLNVDLVLKQFNKILVFVNR